MVIRCRICIISAFRIKSIQVLDFACFTYSVVDVGIWSILEPCLGIINACARPSTSRKAVVPLEGYSVGPKRREKYHE